MKALELALSLDCKDEPLVLVHQKADGKTYHVTDQNNERLTNSYTLQEFMNVRRRPFSSRLYMTDTNINFQTVWQRTRFTDNAKYSAPTRKIRDYVKATLTSHNVTAAKSTIADLLTTWFEIEPSQYYNVACMVASGLSECGKNITFETRQTTDGRHILESKEDQALARVRFTRLMDVLFDKLSLERLLVKDGETNIYRLAHCLNKHEEHYFSWGASLVAFSIQMVLTAYVIFENIKTFAPNPAMIPLTILTTILSILVIFPSLKKFGDIWNFYYHARTPWWHWNSMAIMDLLSNFVLPYILIVSGMIVIMIQEDYLSAVLSSAALLFILEIDDTLPDVLELDAAGIVRNYLIKESIQDFHALYETIMKNHGEMTAKRIEFSDMDLTNTPGEGTVLEETSIFAPYQIEATDVTGGRCVDISPSNFITSNCLISRMEFSYTPGFPLSTRPRIGYLKVTMLKDDKECVMIEKGSRGASIYYKDIDNAKTHPRRVNVDPHEEIFDPYSEQMQQLLQKYGPHDSTSGELRAELDEINPIYVLEGVYMITAFEMSEAIFKLRVVGSKTAGSFEDAMRYYSLWDLDSASEKLLTRKSTAEAQAAKKQSADNGEEGPLLQGTQGAQSYGASA